MGYLWTFLKPSHPYYPAWRIYRRRRRAFWLTTLAILPLVILGSVALLPISYLFDSEKLIMAAPIAVMGGWFLLYQRIVWWPCPRCGKPFFTTWFRHWPFAGQCLHCGLGKYAPCDPAKQQWEKA